MSTGSGRQCQRRGVASGSARLAGRRLRLPVRTGVRYGYVHVRAGNHAEEDVLSAARINLRDPAFPFTLVSWPFLQPEVTEPLELPLPQVLQVLTFSEIKQDEAYVEGGLNSDADLRDPLARSYVAPSFIECDTALTLPILGYLAPWAPRVCVA